MLDSYRTAQSGRYKWPQCSYCGRAQDHDCPVVECPLCGTPQCHGHGATCSVCHHGWLPGWSRLGDRGCRYKGCDAAAVATARRRPVCLEHAARVKVTGFGASMPLTEYVERCLEVRDAGKGWQRWTLVI